MNGKDLKKQSYVLVNLFENDIICSKYQILSILFSRFVSKRTDEVNNGSFRNIIIYNLKIKLSVGKHII